MRKLKWKSDRVEGASVKLTDARLDVHRHIHHPGKWLLSVIPHFPDQRVLESDDLEAAKKEALTVMIGTLLQMLEEIRR